LASSPTKVKAHNLLILIVFGFDFCLFNKASLFLVHGLLNKLVNNERKKNNNFLTANLTLKSIAILQIKTISR
jgi:hypothetical protein